MKKVNKGQEMPIQTELGDNILKYQNTMLATQIDILKRELSKFTQSIFSYQCSEENQPSLPQEHSAIQDLQYYQKLCQQLSRRIRIIMAYNKSAIEKKVLESTEDMQGESYECICGAKQIESLKYELLSNFNDKYNTFIKSALQIDDPIANNQEANQHNNDNMIQQSQDIQIENPEQQQQNQQQPQLSQQQLQSSTNLEQNNNNDLYKELIRQWSEEKSQLLLQIEDFKLQNKLVDEQIYQSNLFAELVQYNNTLTANIFYLEDQLEQAQLQIQESFEKQQTQITQIQCDCEIKIKEVLENQVVQKIEIIQQAENCDSLINNLREQIQSLQKIIEDMKIELEQSRKRNQEVQASLYEETQQKQAKQNEINDLKQVINVFKIIDQQEKIEEITLRYEKHKQLLYEIEQEFVNNKSQDFIQRFREFVGYVKMRDDKVKGQEQVIEQKSQDNQAIKKQMQSIFDELDYNAQVYASQIEQNKKLSKLLDETQKNESRAMKERTDEKTKFEIEKAQYQGKISQLEEVNKQINQQNDLFRKLQSLIEQERSNNKEQIRQLMKQDNENKQKLVQKENELLQKNIELKIFNERENLSDSINRKYIKSAEKSKAKQKMLKLQLKSDSNIRGNELLESMKMMINCQQCKKSIKSIILMKCQHMFCKACIDENQKNRNRACPVCRTRYGLEDVKAIKLI